MYAVHVFHRSRKEKPITSETISEALLGYDLTEHKI